MAQRQKGQKIYTTMQGKQIDIDLLRKKNELTPAVGNAKVNARGDLLGPGGKIIKKREEVVREYYNAQSRPVADEPAIRQQPATPVQQAKTEVKPASRKTTRAQEKAAEEVVAKPTQSEISEFEDMDDGWVEDADGNFVQKGE